MIRYDISETDLRARIDHEKASWQTDAAAATALFHQAGTYGEPDDKDWDTQTYPLPPKPFWGQIKSVYMKLQGDNKCAFCERKLTVRKKDHDVEHFRPKRGVVVWPPLPSDPAFPEGYYLLAYNPLNYATACEHCNRGLKKSYFPILGTRLSGQDDPIMLLLERPLLIYPIGHIDTDPEELLGFQGIAPVPKNSGLTTDEYLRARVTIDFFELDVREELLRERAEVIESLYMALTWMDSAPSPDQRLRFQSIIHRMQSARSRHANCARCFVSLYQNDADRAERLADLAFKFLNTLLQ